jgi:uncharacterized membrane protein (UPF0127 family)
VARSASARRRGLAGSGPPPSGVALQLVPCRSVHTAGMRFALDLVWLGADGVVVRVDRAVPPWRMRTCLRARSVVEARAGEGPRFAAALA